MSGGFFVFQREFFDYLNDDPSLFFEHAPLQTLARDEQLAVFPHEDFWMGMDTYREYTELNGLWAARRGALARLGQGLAERMRVRRDATLARRVRRRARAARGRPRVLRAGVRRGSSSRSTG